MLCGGGGNGEDWRVVIDLIVSCVVRGGMIKNEFSMGQRIGIDKGRDQV